MDKQLQSNQLVPEQMLGSLEIFREKVESLAAQLGLDLSSFQADHIALRINDPELAALAHQAWLKFGKEISSARINGRPIIVIEFSIPLKIKSWLIECLELPYPAKGKLYPQQGWEHVEFVINSDAHTAEEYLTDLRSRFSELDKRLPFLAECGIKTKLSSPKGEGERLANPTVAFKKEGICIKLHPHSLKDVVNSEKAAED